MNADVNSIRESRTTKALEAHEDIRSVPPAMTIVNVLPKTAFLWFKADSGPRV